MKTQEKTTVNAYVLLKNLERIAQDHQTVIAVNAKTGLRSTPVHHIFSTPYEPESYKQAARLAIDMYREHPQEFQGLNGDLVEAGFAYINDGSIAI